MTRTITPHLTVLGKSLISLKQGNVTKMELLARSLDCYLIEHIWEDWGRAITSMDNPPQNLGELRQALLDNRAEIPVERLQRLVASMPRSLAAIIAVRCRNTQYRPGIHNTTPTGIIMQKKHKFAWPDLPQFPSNDMYLCLRSRSPISSMSSQIYQDTH